MKVLKSVKLLIVHCVANRCNKPFSVESLINTGKQKWGQVSYHWYVRRNGDIIPLLSESVQGIHVKDYNWCSLGIVYEGGLDEFGHPADTRTEAQKHALIALLRALKADYPDAQILGHRDLPWVKKDCPCFDARAEYLNLKPLKLEQ
jgi:N-acetyl-anhydromuramyl-L-alanine amidase AmpD